MPSNPDASREPYTYVHRGTHVEGSIVADGRMRVDGTVSGEVRVSDVLEVAPGGRIEGGPVRASEVRVAGTVFADVHAEGKVEIWRDGEVRGSVHAATLDVEEGARFSGRSLMPGDESPGTVASGDPTMASDAASGPPASETPEALGTADVALAEDGGPDGGDLGPAPPDEGRS